MNNISNNDKAHKSGAMIKEQQSPSIQVKSKQILAPPTTGPSSEAYKDSNDRKPPATATVGGIVSVSGSEDSVQEQRIRHKARQSLAGSKGGGTDDTASVVSSAASANRPSSESSVEAFSVSGSSTVQEERIRHKARQFRAGSKGGGTHDTASVVSPATSATIPSSESSVGAFSVSGSSTVQEERIRHKARQFRAGSRGGGTDDTASVVSSATAASATRLL
jgi:hypothetical protein